MRKGSWIETASGKQMWPLEPRPEDVCIEDIAHALSLLCRYNGHCRFFYSVGQHSINCAKHALRQEHSYRVALLALLHDAAEAYVSDLARPIKPFVKGFGFIEYNLQQVIYEALKIKPPNPEEEKVIKQIDGVLLVTEAPVLMHFNGWGDWVKGFEADKDIKIEPKPTEDIRQLFVDTFCILKQRGRLNARHEV